MPSFSNPTRITNPLFPIGRLRSALLLGRLDGKPWRAETTLLPYTRVVDWNGRRVETRESQFVAYLGGRIFEVAVDHYAQADDGSVWYLGENAFSYKRGRVADTEGTWLAGVDGPPAMIMPANPHVGDVYRTENIPGVVFEEVTIERVGVTLNGPVGPVRGAIVGREVHMDEARLEDKVFAPGYGEFHSGAGRTFEATALALPADALSRPMPGALRMLFSRSIQVLDAVRSRSWSAATAALHGVNTAWRALPADAVPSRVAAEMGDAVDAAVHARTPRRAGDAALAVAGAALDLQLRFRPPAAIDLARFDLRLRQLLLDAAAGDRPAVSGDIATLEWIRDRLELGSTDSRRLDAQLRYLRAAAEAGEPEAVTVAAARLREAVARHVPKS